MQEDRNHKGPHDPKQNLENLLAFLDDIPFGMEEAELDSYLKEERVDFNRFNDRLSKDIEAAVKLGSLDSKFETMDNEVAASATSEPAADILSEMPVDLQRHVATSLGVPRLVITSIRERKVRPETIKRRFLERFAVLLNKTADDLHALLGEPAAGLARSYKSDIKPDSSGQISFEELLIQAGVSEERRAQLLAEEG